MREVDVLGIVRQRNHREPPVRCSHTFSGSSFCAGVIRPRSSSFDAAPPSTGREYRNP